MKKSPKNHQKLSIILIHGWAAHSGFFDDTKNGLVDFSIYTPNLPGHGDNTIAGDDVSHVSIVTAARWLNEYISENKIERPILVGWSMGALVSLEYIREYGDAHLAGLVIVDMTPKVLNSTDWPLGILGGLNEERNQKSFAYISNSWKKYAEGMLPVFFAKNKSLPDCSEWVANELLKNNSEAMAHYWNSMTAQDYRELLPNISIPALIISGAQSQLYSRDTAEYFAKSIPHAELEVFEQSGHSPHMEESEKFARVIEGFADGLH